MEMRRNRSPLISIHVAKAGGTLVGSAFARISEEFSVDLDVAIHENVTPYSAAREAAPMGHRSSSVRRFRPKSWSSANTLTRQGTEGTDRAASVRPARNTKAPSSRSGALRRSASNRQRRWQKSGADCGALHFAFSREV
jgi:hypothetical protein